MTPTLNKGHCGAVFYDGKRPVAQDVVFAIPNDGAEYLTFRDDQSRETLWPLADLRGQRDRPARAGMEIRRLDSDELLYFEEKEAMDQLVDLCPDLFASSALANPRRYSAWIVASLASILFSYFLLLPQMSAALISTMPIETANSLGDVRLRMLRERYSSEDGVPARVCSTEEGDRAFELLLERLLGDVDLPYPLRPTVLDIGDMNAVAQPGGRLTVMKGIFKAAETPEQLAGALAHEIGHLYYRHGTTRALREAASTGILDAVLGSVGVNKIVEGLSEQMIFSSYRRDIEREADLFAHEVLRRQGIPLTAMTDLFTVMSMFENEQTGVMKYLRTHPGFGERITAAEGSLQAESTLAPVPLLSDEEWTALRNICH